MADQPVTPPQLEPGAIPAEPLPPGDVLATLPNVTLSAPSAFRTPEASEALIRRALDIAFEIAKGA